ncbi:NfeD family protein [Blastococcus sp. TF02-8]|uniref:NfeD family protein n=1 Tax=Blastococcus sp. TF02-8 TaxID=2250574 RepID=UPI000DEB9D63|nr:NfeD family protein [Blastococcus sp. TF02-8]RBY97768.1 NfeD family protein [Blastococcus sp. TF02-8]
MAAWLIWLIGAVVLAVGEVLTVDLVLLMLAGGALGGMAAALLGGGAVVQVIAFIAVSGLLMAGVRPIARRHLENRTPRQPDGVETFIGRTATVTEAVGRHGGRVRMGADEWSARTEQSADSYAVGATVRILAIDGATAVVGDALE